MKKKHLASLKKIVITSVSAAMIVGSVTAYAGETPEAAESPVIEEESVDVLTVPAEETEDVVETPAVAEEEVMPEILAESAEEIEAEPKEEIEADLPEMEDAPAVEAPVEEEEIAEAPVEEEQIVETPAEETVEAEPEEEAAQEEVLPEESVEPEEMQVQDVTADSKEPSNATAEKTPEADDETITPAAAEDTFTGFRLNAKKTKWVYYVNGVPQNEYTGLAKGTVNGQTQWWYVKNGKVNFTYKGFTNNGNGWYYVKDGTIYKNGQELTKGTIQDKTGWWLVNNGKVSFKTTVAPYGSELLYVKNGMVDPTYTGFGNNKEGWWYLKDGRVDRTVNSIYKGVVNKVKGWWNIKAGKVSFKTTVAKNHNGWYYVNKGKIDNSYTGIAKNEHGYWYIKKGKVDFDYKGYAANKDSYWYVKNGMVQTKYTGIRKRDGMALHIRNGKVVNSYFDGVYMDVNGKAVGEHTGTLKNLLRNGLLPVGTTLYIWGGGHAGTDAALVGVNPNWQLWYASQGSRYNYRNYRWYYGYGLDCSGYVGWTLYNTLYNAEDQAPTVTTVSGSEGVMYQNMGLGKAISRQNIKSYRPGDIMYNAGHTWICLGTASDGSVLLVHSSPQGVHLSGTPTPGGNTYSKAYRMAIKYMKKYYPDYYSRYGISSKNYLGNYDQFRLSCKPETSVTDPDGIRKMSAEEVMKLLFN